MSTTLDRRHALLLDQISVRAVSDLLAAWDRLPRRDIDRLVAELQEIVPALTLRWGEVAASVGADYVDAVRDYYAPPGSFRASPAAAVGEEQVRASVRFASGPLFATRPDEPAALRQLSASLQRLVREADRETVAGNATADPAAQGWRRVARPGACEFCLMLVGREGAYASQAAASSVGAGASRRVRGSRSAGQSYHDNCKCFAAPVYPGWEPGADVLRAQELYAQSVVPGSTRRTLANMRRLMAGAS